MLTRREALGSIAATPLALEAVTPRAAAAVPKNTSAVARAVAAAVSLIAPDASPDEVARDEVFWARVQQAFTIDRTYINLNNGGVSPSPAIVQEAMKRHLDFANTTPPPIALWDIQEPRKETVRARLARHWGVDAQEIAITRNSSESLQICQQGFDLKPGDEVLTTTQDYPRMVTTFKQRMRREGLVYNQFKIPIPAEEDDLIVRLYEQNITPRTRLILMSHVINITGQIMPVKRVVAMARSKGIPVIVDGAHALCQINFKISDLDCDYYGVSLHKWLTAPHGSGLLYVRRDKIKGLWPLMASEQKQDDDIRKFEEIGTHPAANFLAIAEALTFHQSIGDANKEARLRYLRDYWAKRLLKADKRVRLHTSLKPQFSCAIGTVQIDGMDMVRLAEWLLEEHRILTVRIKHDEFDGLRITPNVYTTREELDRFCEVMEWALANGVPAKA
jgi:selenocysteine lyase/cysteine desulfurase